MKDPTFTRLCRARDFLRESCAEPLTVPRVAEVANLSPFHFVRRFEALFGQTPHQYRTQVRIARARELLALGGHSVTETCLALGFSSVGSFSSLFTRRVGVSPQAFQRAARAVVCVPGPWPLPLFPGCLSLFGLLPPAAFRNFREARVPGPG